ncbi:hypothetical protein [Kribbella sp. NPDC048915]|uniref:hypothetical protein n=1 Tax=Kribbella sp. NPDC048915 TaxID=3155148 RepID=UPI0033FE19AC
MRKVIGAVRATGVLAATVLLVACGSEAGRESGSSGAGGQPSMTPSSSPSDPSSTPSSPSSSTPSASPSATPGGSVTDQAKADLAQRLGVDAAQIRVISSEEVTWRDGSLGCPEPGMMYTQALVPGTRTVLEAGGKQYHYHSGGHRAPFLCERPSPPTG